MRIILCDPAQLFATSVGAALRDRGHDCIVVDSVPVPGDEPAVYVLDISDAELLMKLVTPPDRPVVVVVTDREDGFVLREAVDTGALGLVSTDTTVSQVVAAIEQVGHGRPWYDERLLRAALDGHVVMSDPDASRLAAQLTPREHDVLTRIVRGDTTETMAAGLGISTATVRSHVQTVMSKLGVHSRLAAAAFALTHRITGGR